MKPNTKAKTDTLPGVANALHRAAQRARAIAVHTRTPLVLSINERIEKRWVKNGDPDLRGAFERYLNAVPDAELPESDSLT